MLTLQGKLLFFTIINLCICGVTEFYLNLHELPVSGNSHYNYSDDNNIIVKAFSNSDAFYNAQYLIFNDSHVIVIDEGNNETNETGMDVNESTTDKNDTYTTDVPHEIPDCEVGNANCTQCRDVSPFCHYMYSERRCIYFNARHASVLYECGVRWYPKDSFAVFYITIAILLIVTFAISGYFMWLWFRMEIMKEDDLSADERTEMRLAVEMIRQRRLAAKNSGNSDNNNSESNNSESNTNNNERNNNSNIEEK